MTIIVGQSPHLSESVSASVKWTKCQLRLLWMNWHKSNETTHENTLYAAKCYKMCFRPFGEYLSSLQWLIFLRVHGDDSTPPVVFPLSLYSSPHSWLDQDWMPGPKWANQILSPDTLEFRARFSNLNWSFEFQCKPWSNRCSSSACGGHGNAERARQGRQR